MESALNEPLPWSWRFAAKDTGPEWGWRHFDLMNAEAIQQAEADLEIPEFARQILTGMDETPRIEAEGDVVAGVLPAFARTDDPDELVAHWRFAMTMKWLVTGRQHPTRTLVRLRELVQNGLSPANPAALIDLCIGEFAREARGRLAVLDRALDEVEDRLMEAREAASLHALGGRVGVARREAADLKHAVTPLGRTLRLDADELPNWAEIIAEGSGHRILHGVLDDIAAIYDQARALQDELTTRLAEETNRRLYVVSVVTLITGVFSML
jgi:Mg2+ and Co2+ transporter CorA